jgi:DNA-nicking Smr family endonuclease
MGRKKRHQQPKTTQKDRLAADDDAYRPFQGIRLVEKTTEPEPTDKRPVKPVPKRKSGPIVTGYDKDADFGDILKAWESGQDPSTVKGGLKHPSTVDDRRDFGDIFAEWEREHGQKASRPVAKQQPKINKSQPYRQTKDFGSILSQYEGTDAKPVRPVKQRKPTPEPVVPVSRPEIPYKPSQVKGSGKSFGELLDQFEGKETIVPKAPEPVATPPAPSPIPSAEVHPSDVAWKVELTRTGASKGVLQETYQHPESPVAEEEEDKEQHLFTPSEVQGSGKDFGTLLDSYEQKKAAEDSDFAKIYASWSTMSDEEKAIERSKQIKREPDHPNHTISELRAMQPQVTLDLHGMKAEEAATATGTFLEDSYRHHLLKVCVIPGKGLHSADGKGVLKDIALSEIRLSGVVREAYSPKACYGGSGVIWVILKPS